MTTMSIRKIEDESAIIWLEDGIIFFKYKHVVIDLETQKRNIECREILSDGVARPVFTDSRAVKYWTAEARKFASSQDAMKLIKAVAVQYRHNWQCTIVNWSKRFYSIKVPIKAVTEREAGIEWLKQYL